MYECINNESEIIEKDVEIESYHKLSDTLETIHDYLDNVQMINSKAYERLTYLNQQSQDLLHKLELKRLTTSELAKLARELRDCRQERRETKDLLDILDPLVKFLSNDKSKTFLNKLLIVIDQIKVKEIHHEDRVYKPRVLEEEPYVDEFNE